MNGGEHNQFAAVHAPVALSAIFTVITFLSSLVNAGTANGALINCTRGLIPLSVPIVLPEQQQRSQQSCQTPNTLAEFLRRPIGNAILRTASS